MGERNLLIYCEELTKVTHLLNKAKEIQKLANLGKTVLFIADSEADQIAEELSSSGVDQILTFELNKEERFPEIISSMITEIAQKYAIDLLLMLNNPFERELSARVGVKLDASVVTGCLQVSQQNGSLIAEKLLYGGVVTGNFAIKHYPAILTLNENACREPYAGQGSAEITQETFDIKPLKKRVISVQPVEKTVDLREAERIVSIGRGLNKKEDLPIIEDLASALNAQLACSRPLVEDYKWLKVERQVGLTGVTVAPKLYMAIGISGQIQHIVGMKDAQVIVAINNNPNAPIFEVADYGIVGDLYEIVPSLQAAAMKHAN